MHFYFNPNEISFHHHYLNPIFCNIFSHDKIYFLVYFSFRLFHSLIQSFHSNWYRMEYEWYVSSDRLSSHSHRFPFAFSIPIDTLTLSLSILSLSLSLFLLFSSFSFLISFFFFSPPFLPLLLQPEILERVSENCSCLEA